MLFNTLVLLLAGASAHPGESHEVSDNVQLARRNFVSHVKREGGSCNTLARRSEQIAENHRTKISQLRREVAAKKAKRDDSDATRYASIDHESSRDNITADISLSDLFTSDDSTCLLQPEVTNGPYYVTGEMIRDDISEDQEGIPLYMSTEFFDINSCETIPNLYLEIWHCNALGVYSGVQASTNGNGNDYYNETFLRGTVETDSNGAATMKTIFPGHYEGRATHIHAMVRSNATVYENGTIGSGTTESGNVLHVGQLFFDQDLITEVSSTSPYSENDQEITQNTSDDILVSEEGANAPDPFFKYVKLGDDISDGIYAWIAIGVDSTASYTASPAAYYDAEGGHSTGDTMGPGGSGGMGGPGGNSSNSGPGGEMPSGEMPSGSGVSSGVEDDMSGSTGNSSAISVSPHVSSSTSASAHAYSSKGASSSGDNYAAETTGRVAEASSGASSFERPEFLTLALLGLGSLAAVYL